jgi:hypothetical protein
MKNETLTNPPAGQLDIIGDIHGQLTKLQDLLIHLGYTHDGISWSHPQRRVLFLGDYIDRGPQIRETLHLVKDMVDHGRAMALMGNHELNAILFHTLGADGQPLRPHISKNVHQHQATLDAFKDLEEEWGLFLEWMKSLPMFLDLGSLRAVHACWCEDSIRLLKGKSLQDHGLLIKAGTKGTPEYQATEMVLKGPELELPQGEFFRDKDGTERDTMRVSWWGRDDGPQLAGEIVMPPGAVAPQGVISPDQLKNIPNYTPGTIPVFFGHYWLDPRLPKQELAAGICCLDFSAAKDGPMLAYRWDGEQELQTDKFIMIADTNRAYL